jgi:ribosomal protein S2
LAPGRYRPVVFVAQRGLAQDPIDRFAADFTFLVTATRPLGGMVEIPVEVDVTRVERVLAGEMPA